MVDELVAPGVEVAEKGADFERRVGEEAGIRNRPAPVEAERADEDLVLGELDKDGHGPGTFIAKATRFLPGWPRFPVGRPGRRHPLRVCASRAK